MDAVLTTLIGAAPQLGAATGAIALLWLLIRWAGQDRTDYRAQLGEQATRHSDELKRINDAHDAELQELREEIARMRTRINELNQKLDDERERRRAAEDNRMPPRHRQDPRWQ